MTPPTKSRSVTIRLKAVEKYFDVILFVLEYFENEISIRVIFFGMSTFVNQRHLDKALPTPRVNNFNIVNTDEQQSN